MLLHSLLQLLHPRATHVEWELHPSGITDAHVRCRRGPCKHLRGGDMVLGRMSSGHTPSHASSHKTTVVLTAVHSSAKHERSHATASPPVVPAAASACCRCKRGQSTGPPWAASRRVSATAYRKQALGLNQRRLPGYHPHVPPFLEWHGEVLQSQ